MHPTAVLLTIAGLSAATTIPVSVGKNGLTFEPNMIHAQEGDVIEFRFWPRNHSVVAGHFNEACRPASENGFFSGFFPTQPDTVNTRCPATARRKKGQDAKNGMVAVINPAGVGRLSLAAYAALARASAGNATSPSGGVFGGVVAPNQSQGGGGGGGGGGGSVSATGGSSVTGGSGSATATSGGGSASGASSSTVEDSETETQTQTQTESTAESETTAAATTTTGGGGGATVTSATEAPTGTETGNAAAGVVAPVAGLVAVVMGAFFV
ncbi:hypothetical protein CHGG_04260 [Chaetomium globosum CBS 148.51]|uniref:Phytocyanin domain-containing protein n=1 Tax=Chaetomium globosum (strain ATCC 6205 / CBS 148.51 / DSM 1962 / NBRC 6347 / NRRL 1970) TaxID=306901 RepID=Q2H1T6_CHAGB|nr:uncharacterized protein CHGG_04260 [Chaetomium globosum CBS 148.51]EAQ87641.1 hypothetical protein CHGG_04260 [Chaetomium globosum CBS 148.51]